MSLPFGAAALGIVSAVPFAIGMRDRIFAMVLAPAVLLPSLDGPDIIVPLVTIVPLLVHVGLPSAPYGSVDARGRPDPRGDFVFPASVTFAVHAVLAGAYVAHAWPMVAAGEPSLSEWAFAGSAAIYLVLGLGKATRFTGWVIMLAALVGRVVVGDDPLALPLFFVHLLAFDGAAVAPARYGKPERVFYDGACGLCHRAVRFALAEDPDGNAFRFAPLGGEAFEAEVPAEAKSTLPDSIVLLTVDGDLLVRSRAIFRMMERLGGLFRVLAFLFGLFPSVLLDLAYDGVAKVRHRLFQRPKDVCPIIPKALRPRFDL
jgi:predicted DCC family thiol-disulfide oxidoreductase YuxK